MFAFEIRSYAANMAVHKGFRGTPPLAACKIVGGKMKNLLFIFIMLISAITLLADWNFDQKVFDEYGTGGDSFGSSVSISGEFAIIGAPLNEYPLGAAYLYKKVNDNWIDVEKIQGSDSISTQYFGSSVFINGNYMIIAANRGYINIPANSYIYHFDGANWIEMDIIEASGSTIYDHYGCSVGITEDGEYAIVGASNDNENGEAAGAAYIYKYEDSQWIQQIKLMALDGLSLGEFGYSTYITNNFAYIKSAGSNHCGSIYIYQNTGDNWDYYTTLTSTYSTPDLQMGSPISISEDYLIIGSSTDYYGAAFIFQNTGSQWIEQEPIMPSDSFEYDHFGYSVSISGNTLVVGALDCPDVGNSASAYFFENINSEWIEINKLTIDNWGGFGKSVSISGEDAIVGANLDWGYSSASGAAYFISNDETSIGKEIITNSNISDAVNHPNPFNPTTIISFSILDESNVDISIYNIKGQKVKQLVNDQLSAGEHSVVWDGRDDNEKTVGSGLYFYKIKTKDKELTKKMLLLK